MFKVEARHLNKTNVEKNYHRIISKDIDGMGIPCMGVTCDYRYRLQHINNYLRKIYGDELANWNVSIGKYLSLMKQDPTYCSVNAVDDIPLITDDIIFQIINYDALTERLALEAKACVEKWKNDNDIIALINACDIFGIFPRLQEDPARPQLNHFLVDWPISLEKLIDLQKKVLSDPQKVTVLGMAADLLSMAYNDQYYATFPFVGTMLTQPKKISYYRGENAYYGSSRPSLYRSEFIRSLPLDVQQAVRKMKYDECGIRIFDKLKATVDWTNQISDCNYLAFMQHHGLPTEMMDITSDFKVALFFACCKYVGSGSLAHWEPLRKSDFERADSRDHVAKLGGDSRYGIIYRSSTEFEDYLWTNVNPLSPDVIGKTDENLTDIDRDILELWNHIVPVGYQAFNRSGLQSGYMLETGNPNYDMLKDTRFAKHRFRLSENMCEWIYQEMNKGDAIYPRSSDVPDISKYISKIAKNPTVFSKGTFDDYVKMAGLSQPDAKDLESRLLNYGYIISNNDIDYIPDTELDEINRTYTIDVVCEKYDIRCSGRPFMVMFSGKE